MQSGRPAERAVNPSIGLKIETPNVLILPFEILEDLKSFFFANELEGRIVQQIDIYILSLQSLEALFESKRT